MRMKFKEAFETGKTFWLPDIPEMKMRRFDEERVHVLGTDDIVPLDEFLSNDNGEGEFEVEE